MTDLLCTIFFVSGASALIFETLWFRQAGLAFGNSVWASSLVLSAFMGGLALGSALTARYGTRLRNPIGAYAIAEVAIALIGVGLVYLFPVLGVALAPWLYPVQDHAWILNPLRLLIAFILLLIPSTAMGVTLPLLTKTLTAYDSRFGRVLGQLYGWNTLGAVVGVIVGETYLIAALGVHGSALAAGSLSLIAAAAAAWLSTRTPRQAQESAHQGWYALHRAAGRRWLAAAFVSGFCLLALEVVWFRFLLLFVIGYSTDFALMLGVVLAGIASGGLAGSQWLRRFPDAHRFAPLIAFATGLLCIGSYAGFPLVIEPFGLSTIENPAEILQIGVPLMFPVSFLSGVFFTLIGAALHDNLISEIETTGILTLANTTGAALGSLIGGFLLLPVFGMERSFFLISLLYGGLGALLLLRGEGLRRIAYISAGAFVLSTAFFPFGSMEKRLLQIPEKRWLAEMGGTANVAAIREGLTETIIYFESRILGKPVSYSMLTNAYSMSGTMYQSRRYMKLYAYWPIAVHPNLKRALLIGYGAGNTAKALTDSKSIESIDVVDTSRDILEMSDIVFPREADQPLHDARVRVHIEDGRYFLQATRQRFDLITAEPPPPYIAGVVNVYTREYFKLLRERLAEGGILTYWLPIHALTDVSTKAILRAFCDAFDDCSLWNGMGTSLMMVGTRSAQGPISQEQFTRQWLDSGVAPEMKALGFERPEQLGALFVGDAAYLKGLIGDSPPLVDDRPKEIEALFRSQAEVDQISLSFTDVAAARERFRHSSLIKRLWPEPLLTASLPYFEFQDIINSNFYGGALAARHAGFEDTHRLLNDSSLSSPALWRLGSDSDIQRIVANAEPAELARPEMQFHLGIDLISKRNFAAAVEPLRRAEEVTALRADAFQLRIYALCMSGQADQAQYLAQERLTENLNNRGLTAGSLNGASLTPFWLWMKKTFGIDPLASARTSVPG